MMVIETLAQPVGRNNSEVFWRKRNDDLDNWKAEDLDNDDASDYKPEEDESDSDDDDDDPEVDSKVNEKSVI